MSRLRVAVLGAAHPHVRDALAQLRARDDIDLVAAAEPDETLRRQFLGDVDVPDTADPFEVLDRVQLDAVVAAGVYSERAALVCAAARRGIPVLVDKPLCTTHAELESIAAAAVAGSAPVSLLLEKRSAAPTLTLHALLRDGVLGEIASISSTAPHKLLRAHRPDWFWQRRRYGGILADLGVHDLDLLLALTRPQDLTVTAAQNSNLGLAGGLFADHGAVLLRSQSVVSTIDVSWLTPAAETVHGRYRMTVTGTRGVAELDWAADRLVLATEDLPPHAVDLLPGQPGSADFFDALQEGRLPLVGTTESVAVTDLALLAQRSAESGSTLHWTARS